MKLTVSALVLSFIVSAQAANTITSATLPSGIPGSASLSSLISSESSLQQSIFSSESSLQQSIFSSDSSVAQSIHSSDSSIATCVHSALSSFYSNTPSSFLTSLPCTINPTTTSASSSGSGTGAGAEATTTSGAAGRTEAGMGLAAGVAAGLLAFLFY